MKQISEFTVNSHEEDFNGIVSASSVLRYMQETANLEHYYYGPTTDELRERNIAFVISRVAMKIYEPLEAFDKIKVESWLYEKRGFSFTRFGRICREGKTVAESSAIWAIVDTKTGELLRADSFEPGFGADGDSVGVPLPRLKIPTGIALEKTGAYRVGYEDADLNRHMNNTRYPDILCDFLPAKSGGEHFMNGMRVVEMTISYLKEAKLGSSFEVYAGEKDGVFYIRTALENGDVGAEASVKLEAIA